MTSNPSPYRYINHPLERWIREIPPNIDPALDNFQPFFYRILPSLEKYLRRDSWSPVNLDKDDGYRENLLRPLLLVLRSQIAQSILQETPDYSRLSYTSASSIPIDPSSSSTTDIPMAGIDFNEGQSSSNGSCDIVNNDEHGLEHQKASANNSEDASAGIRPRGCSLFQKDPNEPGLSEECGQIFSTENDAL